MAADYDKIETLEHETGVALDITVADKPNGFKVFSFTLYKKFQRREGGPIERTTYLNDRHIPAVRELLDQAEARIAVEKDKMHACRRRGQRCS